MNFLLEVCLSNAIVATALAFIVAAVSRTRRQPVLTHILWVIVILKLLSPPLFRIPIAWRSEVLSSEVGPLDVADSAPSYVLAASEVIGGVEHNRFAQATDTIGPETHAELRNEPSRDPISPLNWDVLRSRSTIVFVWIAGSCVWFSVAVVRLVRFHRLLRHGRAAPPRLQAHTEQIARRLGMKSCPKVWLVPGRVSPLLWALSARAKLVLPEELFASLEADQQDSLVVHELAHARRWDHWVRWVEFLVLGLYWWHPIAWWARWEIRQAEEACCDAWVVSTQPGIARAYAEALVETVGFLTGARQAVPPLASGIGHVHLLRRRLTMILRPQQCHRASWRVQLGALLLGLTVLPFAPYPARLQAEDYSLTIPAEQGESGREERDGRDLEQRLQALEAKLEKVLTRLETAEHASRTDQSSKVRKEAKRSEDRAVTAEKQTKEMAEEMRAKAKKAADAAKAQAPADSKEPKAAATAAKKSKMDAEAALRAATEATKKQTDSEGLAQLGRQLAEAIRENFDPERMAELGRQIGEAVSRSVDPDQMAEFGRQIEQAVNKSFDAKEIEALERQIEEAVNKNFDPERIRDLEQQIEGAVKKATDPERMEELERMIEEIGQKNMSRQNLKEIERQKEKTIRADAKRDTLEITAPNQKSAVKSPKVSKTPTLKNEAARRSEKGDVEDRLRTLEEKVDRVLKVLESRGESAR